MRLRKKNPWYCPKCNYQIKSSRQRHLNYCTGNGTRKNQKLIGLIQDKIYYKGKTYEERYGEIRSKLIKQKLSDKSKEGYKLGRLTGMSSTIEDEKIRRIKIRNSINERYKNGWLPKAGRCKKINYKSSIAGKIKLDGNWELAVAKYFDLHNINWKRNSLRFKYIDNDKIRFYTPDFYLIDTNEYIEVKGYTTELDKLKWKQFPYKLIIFDKKKLQDLKILIGSKPNVG